MNNLERLYNARKELDKVMEEIEQNQSKVKGEIIEKRTIGWEQMFNDLYSLRKYSNFIDTGIKLYKDYTLGFEIKDNYICVISWEHFNCDKKTIESRAETYYFTITKDKPFEAISGSYIDRMKYVIKVIENWDEVMVEIERRLSKQMELEMAKRFLKAEKRQIELENQLEAISR